MLKKIVSGVTALVLALTMTGVNAFADGYDDEGMDDVVSGDNYWESTNFVVLDFLEGMDKSSTIYEINWNDGNKDKDGNDKTGHSDIADYVNDLLSNKYKKNYPNTKKEELCKCLVFGSYIADNQDMHHDKGAQVNLDKPTFYPKLHNGDLNYDDYASQLHAISKVKNDKKVVPDECGNYLLYLECLWLYAKYAGKEGYVQYKYNFHRLDWSVMPDYIYNVDKINSKIKSDIGYSRFSNYKKEDIDQLLDVIPYVFYHYSDRCITKKKFDYMNGLSNDQKQFLVLGLGLHLIGDSYAHRGIIPTHYGMNKSDGNTKDEFNIHFINTKRFVDDEKEIAEMKKYIMNGEMYGTMFRHYMKDKKTANTYYEDNADFVSDRFYLSKVVSKRYIDVFINKSTDFKTALNRNKIYKYDKDDNSLGEIGTHGERINIYKFKSYKDQI